jgi:PPOX class probable F420-dependent enzyme
MSEQINPAADALLTIAESTEFGARAAKHLREDLVVWLTTVSPSGVPTPNPVWFIWDGAATVRLFSMPSSARIRHLQNNPRVSLNFACNDQGDDIVVLIGTAAVDPKAPAADAVPEFVAMYAERLPAINLTPSGFAERYAVPITITLNRLRGY